MALFRPGTQVGDARIVRELGAGEVATVYEVVHGGARRALKIIESGVVEEGSTTQARAAQEGEAIAMVEHVNVVRWYDSGIDHGRVWILIELVEGSNLHQLRLAAGGQLPVERAVALARQACDGLAAVHKKGIVHRDMKPENILVTRDDVAKIADFGSAKLPGWGVKTTTAHRLTSMAYMAPELWRGDAPDRRCDVYAMGLILYEMITGANPIVPRASDMVTMCTRHLQYEPPPLASLVADMPYGLSVLVQRAMAKDPAQRCTMRELADGLEEVLDRLLVWRRAAARSLPLPHQDPALALTLPMLAIPEPESSTPTPGVGARGTIVMRAVSSRGPDREASPPPPPAPMSASPPLSHAASPSPPASMSVPSTLRTPFRPLPAPPLRPPPAPPQPMPPLAVASEPDPRRSTGIPVESTARLSGTTPRRRALGAVFGGGVLVALVTAAWWTLSGTEPRAVPKPAAPPPVTSASAPPPPSASIVKPSSVVPPRRSPRRAPPHR